MGAASTPAVLQRSGNVGRRPTDAEDDDRIVPIPLLVSRRFLSTST